MYRKTCFFHFKRKYLAICVVKNSEFFPHILILVSCKILWLDVQKEQFSKKFTLCYKNNNFECFLVEKGLGILGVNTCLLSSNQSLSGL